MSDERPDIRIERDRTLYHGYARLEAYAITVRPFAGAPPVHLEREVLVRPNGAAVLPIDPIARTVVLVEQFRPAAWVCDGEGWLLECIAGLVDGREAPGAAARREAWEEAGCKLGPLTPCGVFYASPGSFTERVHLYRAPIVARERRAHYGCAREGEALVVRDLAFDEAFALVRSGAVRDAKTLVALQSLMLAGAAALAPPHTSMQSAGS